MLTDEQQALYDDFKGRRMNGSGSSVDASIFLFRRYYQTMSSADYEHVIKLLESEGLIKVSYYLNQSDYLFTWITASDYQSALATGEGTFIHPTEGYECKFKATDVLRNFVFVLSDEEKKIESLVSAKRRELACLDHLISAKKERVIALSDLASISTDSLMKYSKMGWDLSKNPTKPYILGC